MLFKELEIGEKFHIHDNVDTVWRKVNATLSVEMDSVATFETFNEDSEVTIASEESHAKEEG